MAGEFDDNPLSTAAPRRNPGLIQRILRAVVKSDPSMGPQPLQQQTTQTGVVHPAADYNDQFYVFSNDTKRLAVYRDVDEMDDSSEEVSVALDTISNNGTTSEDGTQLSFEVHSDDANVQEVIDNTVKTAKLKEKIHEVFRNFVKYGDYFGEPLLSGELDIVGLRSLPPSTMYRNQDKYGNLATGKPVFTKDGKCENKPEECAFEQHEGLSQKLIATFWPWQIVHARHNFDGFSSYGRSHFRVARIVWRQLQALVQALVIGRLTRDLLKLVFYVDTTGLSQEEAKQVVKAFKDTMSNRSKVDLKRENPFSVLTDFYLRDGYIRVNGNAVPMRTRVEAIDPKNQGIHDITDIEFLHRKLLSTTRVPPAHMGWEQDAAPGLLSQQDVQYVRILRDFQREVGVQVLEPLFNLALLLKGIDPQTAEYDIVWPALKATDEAAAAQTALAYAQSDQLYLQEGVLSPSWVQEHRFNMDEEQQQAVQDENDELAQRDMEQFQQQQETIAANRPPTAAGDAQGQPGGQPSAHRDQDGQRKGDEGRDRQGNRIAPTKSKRNTQNPTGTGRRSTKTVKAAGSIDRSTGMLLELLRPHVRLIACDAGTADIATKNIVVRKRGKKRKQQKMQRRSYSPTD